MKPSRPEPMFSEADVAPLRAAMLAAGANQEKADVAVGMIVRTIQQHLSQRHPPMAASCATDEPDLEKRKADLKRLVRSARNLAAEIRRAADEGPGIAGVPPSLHRELVRNLSQFADTMGKQRGRGRVRNDWAYAVMIWIIRAWHFATDRWPSKTIDPETGLPQAPLWRELRRLILLHADEAALAGTGAEAFSICIDQARLCEADSLPLDTVSIRADARRSRRRSKVGK